MSKAIVLNVSVEQFTLALSAVIKSGNDALVALTVAAGYISQCTVKKEQDKAKKDLAKAWVDYSLAVEGKTIKTDSAVRWVHRRVLKLAPKGFKWIESKSANAIQKRKARQTKAAETKTAKPVSVPKIPTSIEQLRKALITKEKAIADEYRGVIPAGKIKDFDSAFAAFIQTIEIILA